MLHVEAKGTSRPDGSRKSRDANKRVIYKAVLLFTVFWRTTSSAPRPRWQHIPGISDDGSRLWQGGGKSREATTWEDSPGQPAGGAGWPQQDPQSRRFQGPPWQAPTGNFMGPQLMPMQPKALPDTGLLYPRGMEAVTLPAAAVAPTYQQEPVPAMKGVPAVGVVFDDLSNSPQGFMGIGLNGPQGSTPEWPTAQPTSLTPTTTETSTSTTTTEASTTEATTVTSKAPATSRATKEKSVQPTTTASTQPSTEAEGPSTNIVFPTTTAKPVRTPATSQITFPTVPSTQEETTLPPTSQSTKAQHQIFPGAGIKNLQGHVRYVKENGQTEGKPSMQDSKRFGGILLKFEDEKTMNFGSKKTLSTSSPPDFLPQVTQPDEEMGGDSQERKQIASTVGNQRQNGDHNGDQSGPNPDHFGSPKYGSSYRNFGSKPSMLDQGRMELETTPEPWTIQTERPSPVSTTSQRPTTNGRPKRPSAVTPKTTAPIASAEEESETTIETDYSGTLSAATTLGAIEITEEQTTIADETTTTRSKAPKTSKGVKLTFVSDSELKTKNGSQSRNLPRHILGAPEALVGVKMYTYAHDPHKRRDAGERRQTTLDDLELTPDTRRTAPYKSWSEVYNDVNGAGESYPMVDASTPYVGHASTRPVNVVKPLKAAPTSKRSCQVESEDGATTATDTAARAYVETAASASATSAPTKTKETYASALTASTSLEASDRILTISSSMEASDNAGPAQSDSGSPVEGTGSVAWTSQSQIAQNWNVSTLRPTAFHVTFVTTGRPAPVAAPWPNASPIGTSQSQVATHVVHQGRPVYTKPTYTGSRSAYPLARPIQPPGRQPMNQTQQRRPSSGQLPRAALLPRDGRELPEGYEDRLLVAKGRAPQVKTTRKRSFFENRLKPTKAPRGKETTDELVRKSDLNYVMKVLEDQFNTLAEVAENSVELKGSEKTKKRPSKTKLQRLTNLRAPARKWPTTADQSVEPTEGNRVEETIEESTTARDYHEETESTAAKRRSTTTRLFMRKYKIRATTPQVDEAPADVEEFSESPPQSEISREYSQKVQRTESVSEVQDDPENAEENDYGVTKRRRLTTTLEPTDDDVETTKPTTRKLKVNEKASVGRFRTRTKTTTTTVRRKIPTTKAMPIEEIQPVADSEKPEKGERTKQLVPSTKRTTLGPASVIQAVSEEITVLPKAAQLMQIIPNHKLVMVTVKPAMLAGVSQQRMQLVEGQPMVYAVVAPDQRVGSPVIVGNAPLVAIEPELTRIPLADINRAAPRITAPNPPMTLPPPKAVNDQSKNPTVAPSGNEKPTKASAEIESTPVAKAETKKPVRPGYPEPDRMAIEDFPDATERPMAPSYTGAEFGSKNSKQSEWPDIAGVTRLLVTSSSPITLRTTAVADPELLTTSNSTQPSSTKIVYAQSTKTSSTAVTEATTEPDDTDGGNQTMLLPTNLITSSELPKTSTPTEEPTKTRNRTTARTRPTTTRRRLTTTKGLQTTTLGTIGTTGTTKLVTWSQMEDEELPEADNHTVEKKGQNYFNFGDIPSSTSNWLPISESKMKKTMQQGKVAQASAQEDDGGFKSFGVAGTKLPVTTNGTTRATTISAQDKIIVAGSSGNNKQVPTIRPGWSTLPPKGNSNNPVERKDTNKGKSRLQADASFGYLQESERKVEWTTITESTVSTSTSTLRPGVVPLSSMTPVPRAFWMGTSPLPLTGQMIKFVKRESGSQEDSFNDEDTSREGRVNVTAPDANTEDLKSPEPGKARTPDLEGTEAAPNEDLPSTPGSTTSGEEKVTSISTKKGYTTVKSELLEETEGPSDSSLETSTRLQRNLTNPDSTTEGKETATPTAEVVEEKEQTTKEPQVPASSERSMAEDDEETASASDKKSADGSTTTLTTKSLQRDEETTRSPNSAAPIPSSDEDVGGQTLYEIPVSTNTTPFEEMETANTETRRPGQLKKRWGDIEIKDTSSNTAGNAGGSNSGDKDEETDEEISGLVREGDKKKQRRKEENPFSDDPAEDNDSKVGSPLYMKRDEQHRLPRSSSSGENEDSRYRQSQNRRLRKKKKEEERVLKASIFDIDSNAGMDSWAGLGSMELPDSIFGDMESEAILHGTEGLASKESGTDVDSDLFDDEKKALKKKKKLKRKKKVRYVKKTSRKSVDPITEDFSPNDNSDLPSPDGF